MVEDSGTLMQTSSHRVRMEPIQFYLKSREWLTLQIIRRRLDARATSWEQPADGVFQRRIVFLLSTPNDVASTLDVRRRVQRRVDVV